MHPAELALVGVSASFYITGFVGAGDCAESGESVFEILCCSGVCWDHRGGEYDRVFFDDGGVAIAFSRYAF